MNIPRAEFPNPQFERKNWLCLNGEWQFEIDNSVSGEYRRFWERENFDDKIILPFCPESELSGINNKDFMNSVWYKRSFSVSKKQLEGRIFIHFGAVDYETKVYINGKIAGSHRGGYTPFSIDITDFLENGENSVVVYAKDDVGCDYQPTGKQSKNFYSQGCHYTRTTGIWQSVWLEFTPKEYIKKFRIYPDYKNDSVSFCVNVCGKGTLKAEIFYDGKQVGYAEKSTDGGTVNFETKLEESHLWNVGEGNLYDVKFSFENDEVYSYFGLRNVLLDDGHIKINGKKVFLRTVLDQGFYPDGIYTAKDDESLKKDIILSLEAGFNGARLHQKVFEPRFLYFCDKMGYLVFGEFPDWFSNYSVAESFVNVAEEWINEINRDFNHPSIIGWCPLNEVWTRCNWGTPIEKYISDIFRLTKEYDTTRPCIDASGGNHCHGLDIYDIHDYNQCPESFKKQYDKLMSDKELIHNQTRFVEYNGEPVFMSEYGGIQWNPDSKEGWGYGTAPKSEKEFIERYKGLTDALLDNDMMIGFCYTQLYDVEQELNGLYKYSREPKFDMSIFKKINSRKAKIEK